MKFQVIALGVMCAGAMSMVAVQADEVVAKEHVKGDRTKSRFEVADTNNNGSVSMDEFKAVFAKKPARAQVKEGEVAATAPTAEEAFNKLDTDKSGSLSKEEMMAGRTRSNSPHEGVKKTDAKVEEKPAAQ